MQKKHQFFFLVLGVPTYGEGGGGRPGWDKRPNFSTDPIWGLPLDKCHKINTNHPLPDTATNIWDAQLRRPILTISENLKLFLHLWKDLDKTDSSLSKQMIPRYVLVWLVVKVFFHIKSIMMIGDARCLDLGICLFHLELRCSYAILTNHPYTPDHRKMMMA